MAYHYAKFGAEIALTARREAALQKVQVVLCELAWFNVKNVCVANDTGAGVAYDTGECMGKDIDTGMATYVGFGGLDYLVLNHIGESPYEAWSGDVEHTRWLMQVNFVSYVQLASSALSALAESKGSIVVVSSINGKVATPYTTSYSATKFALDGFFSSLRQELAMQGTDIAITLCILGLIDTDYAMSRIRGKVLMTPYPASEAALAIVKGGTSRDREIHYPWQAIFISHARDWYPEFRDWIIRGFYNTTSTGGAHP
ncbi:hypothetical protein NDU88_006017 [Pleurodeles waltl]|uniref:Hydroxysteroid 11-beta-dehydrogenase 1-like protein n=1 Tax=Pleurodeles waltl TaxID=8319 RepID=A0AAV7L976_PLEWA|nr:hypothetical protein NDU88_006017 [Pleurodeles waltl]